MQVDGKPMTDGQIKDFFKTTDTSGNTTVSLDEAKERGFGTEQFKKADRNHDSELDIDEFTINDQELRSPLETDARAGRVAVKIPRDPYRDGAAAAWADARPLQRGGGRYQADLGCTADPCLPRLKPRGLVPSAGAGLAHSQRKHNPRGTS